MIQKPNDFELLGHDCPLGRYPAPIVPIGRKNNNQLVAVYLDSPNSEPSFISIDKSSNFVQHNDNLKESLSNFDCSKDKLFALSENQVRRYKISNESDFFKSILDNESLDNLSETDPFFRLSLAKATSDIELITAELKQCGKFLLKKKCSTAITNAWYQTEENKLSSLWQEDGKVFPSKSIIFSNEEITKSDDKLRLVEEIQAQGAVNQDLSDADLSNANLRSAILAGANLSGADLSGADLSGANLIRVNLTGANLSNANLSDANLSDANLSNANLSNANLNLALLANADLSLTLMANANLSRTILILANLNTADLNTANLNTADLRGAYLEGANLTYSQLNNANLLGANLINTDLSNAQLLAANLTDANLENASYVENAHFGYNLGISKSQRNELIKKQAIFVDSPPGDDAKVFAPAPAPAPA